MYSVFNVNLHALIGPQSNVSFAMAREREKFLTVERTLYRSMLHRVSVIECVGKQAIYRSNTTQTVIMQRMHTHSPMQLQA